MKNKDLIEELARAAWSVLNHDNPFDESDPSFASDPCHASTKRTLKRKLQDVLKSKKAK
jgi:hypothetical protein